MAAFDFPSSPNVNDIYTLNGVAFMWNGSVWKRYSTSTGAQGFQGATGAAGAQGAQGTNGTIGSDGAQGAVGAQGAQGATGSGATGAQGAAGADGAQGAAGAQGAPFDRSEYNYTASGGQTAFAAAYANASDVDVFMNGVRLTPAEYTPSGGTTITLASGATAGDIIDILTFASAGPTGAQGAQGHQGDAFSRSESNFTATSGQTSFAPSGGYTNGDDLDVFVNGVRLTPADYTATNGTNVVLDVGANTGDIVDIIYYEAAGPAGAQGAAGAAGIAGTITFSTSAPSNPIMGDLWYDTDDGAFAGYYDDGNTSQWIDLSGGPRGAQGADGAQGAAGSIPSNITAVSGTFSGNVSIGGTLTYEDVTNIDSVGVVTARAGVNVTGGSVGIGTDAPAAGNKLHLHDTSACRIQLTTDSTGSSTTDGTRLMVDSSNNFEILNRENSNIEFFTNNTERLRIHSNGNVQVKTDGAQLFGAGTLLVNSGSSSGRLDVYGGSTNRGGEINLYGGSNSDGIIQFRTGAGANQQPERMRIDSSGCVRVGNTHTQTTSSNTKRIALGAKGSIWGWTSGNINGALTLADNYYWDGANNRAIEADEAAYLSLRSGTLRFGTTDSTPSAGGVTGLTEKFRITSDGKIGVNVTNPLSDLHVITAGQTEDGTFRIGGNATSLGLVLDYDQSSATVSRITANPTYTSASSLLKICVDGDANPNQLVLQGDGKIGINNSSPPVKLAVHDSGSNCKLLLSSSWSGTQEIIFGGGSTNSTGSGNSTAAKIIAQASAPGGAATGYLSFYTNVGDNIYERLRLTPEGNIWTVNSSIMHGSGDVTNFATAGRTSNNNVSIRAGNASAGTSPTNSNSAIKIYPAGVRSTTTGNLTGGIAWQHLDPDNGSWDAYYAAGSQIWMGAALHDTPGQERDRFNLWMNNQTSQNSQPNNLAIEAYPNGMVRFPKVPAFYAYTVSNSGLTSAGDQVFTNTRLNNGSCYSTSNGRFTAPIDGMYLVSTAVQLYGQGSGVSMSFRINGTDFHGGANTSQPVYDERAGSHTMLYFTAVVSMSQNDYITVWTNNGIRGMQSYYTGHLVG